ncbi:MAG TPA: hypothetical protein VJQ25_10345 [Nitrospira sp.]|nr:hypothetical protein [Nitrospira sp.]
MTVFGLCLLLIALAGCSDVGGYYAKSLGIESRSQLRKARADYQAALTGFVGAGVLTEEEAKMELHSEVLKLNVGTMTEEWSAGYHAEALRENPRFATYQPQCSWVGQREDVQCKGKRFIADISR